MKCPGIGTIQEFLDGELPDREKGRLADHMTGCKACRAQLDEMQTAVAALMENLERLNAPDVAVPVWSQPEQSERTGQSTKSLSTTFAHHTMAGWLRPIASIAALLLVTFVLYHSYQSDSSLPPAIQPTEWPLPEVALDPNRMWLERSMVITVVDHKAGTLERVVTSNKSGRASREIYQLPAVGAGDSAEGARKGT